MKNKIPVFLSSTSELQPFRDAIYEKFKNSIFAIEGHEKIVACGGNPIDVCLQKVTECPIFIGIIGMRYGNVDEKTGKSIVQLEYETALAHEKEIFIFKIDENRAKIHPKDFECKNVKDLDTFKELLDKRHFCPRFIDESDLIFKITLALAPLVGKESQENRYMMGHLNSTRCAKGDDLKISGISTENQLKSIGLWIFSDDYYLFKLVGTDLAGQFESIIPRETTTQLREGIYFVLLQHPMKNQRLDVFPVEIAGTTVIQNTENNDTIIIDGEDGLKGLDAAGALIGMVDNDLIDDIVIRLAFTVESPWIKIDPIPDIYKGERFLISGTTNVGIDDIVNIEIEMHSSSTLEKFTKYSGFTGSTNVERGIGPDNRWSFEVDSKYLPVGEYTVKALVLKVLVFSSSNLKVVKPKSILPFS